MSEEKWEARILSIRDSLSPEDMEKVRELWSKLEWALPWEWYQPSRKFVIVDIEDEDE